MKYMIKAELSTLDSFINAEGIELFRELEQLNLLDEAHEVFCENLSEVDLDKFSELFYYLKDEMLLKMQDKLDLIERVGNVDNRYLAKTLLRRLS